MKNLSTAGLKTVFRILLLGLLLICLDVAAGTMPDDIMTPGEVRLGLDIKTICSTKWGLDKRFVTSAMKTRVFHNYGFTGYKDLKCIPDKNGKTCEIDHKIPRALGGADSIKNIWPQPFGGEWNAHDKDRLEVRLHSRVCRTKDMTLQQARTCISKNWIKCYKEQFK